VKGPVKTRIAHCGYSYTSYAVKVSLRFCLGCFSVSGLKLVGFVAYSGFGGRNFSRWARPWQRGAQQWWVAAADRFATCAIFRVGIFAILVNFVIFVIFFIFVTFVGFCDFCSECQCGILARGSPS
jgi:hypothetical protein